MILNCESVEHIKLTRSDVIYECKLHNLFPFQLLDMGVNFIQRLLADLWDPKDIIASIRPLLFSGFVSGIAPFKTIGVLGDRQLVPTIFGWLFVFLDLVWFCTSLVQAVNVEDSEAHLFHSEVSRFGEDAQYSTPLVAIGTTFIPCVLKRNKLRLLLNLLAQIDGELSDLGVRIDYNFFLKISWIILIVQWSILFALIGATYGLLRSSEFSLIYLAYCFMPVAIVMTNKSMYYCIMRLIESRFNYINVHLKDLRMNAAEKCISSVDETTFRVDNLCADSTQKRYDSINELCRTHDKLCDVCGLAEQYFNHQMLAMVVIEFVVSVFNLYFMIDVAFAKTPTHGVDTTEFLANYTLYTISSMAIVFCLIRSTESVTKEVSFNKLLIIIIRILLPLVRFTHLLCESVTKEVSSNA